MVKREKDKDQKHLVLNKTYSPYESPREKKEN